MLEEHLTTLTQLGAAGLIGVLWVMERRLAATRDRQLDEAHARLMGRQGELEALLRVVTDNTRAISSLEGSQRRLIELLESRRAKIAARPIRAAD